jgi:hypothetical protein
LCVAAAVLAAAAAAAAHPAAAAAAAAADLAAAHRLVGFAAAWRYQLSPCWPLQCGRAAVARHTLATLQWARHCCSSTAPTPPAPNESSSELHSTRVSMRNENRSESWESSDNCVTSAAPSCAKPRSPESKSCVKIAARSPMLLPAGVPVKSRSTSTSTDRDESSCDTGIKSLTMVVGILITTYSPA